MTFKAEDWVVLPTGGVARVIDVGRDGPHEVVLIETPGGAVDERPLAFAARNWRQVPADGLRVRWATAPELVRRQLDEDPIGVVAAALADAGGTADSEELRDAIGLVVPEPELRTWWKRNQRKLETDERIDTAGALERRYRLLRPGERKSERRRARRSGRMRDGRELLDMPTLLDARERMKAKGPLVDAELADLLAEADLADDPTVEPTDRFLAGEIAVALGVRSESELAARLGTDRFAVDLLRIKEHESRDRALRMALGRDEQEGVEEEAIRVGPVAWSAVAAGPKWAEPLVAWLREAGRPVRPVVARGLTWGIPGSPEAGELNYPRDLETYRKRVPVIAELVETHRDAGNEVVAAAVLEGLRQFEVVPQHGTEWASVARTLCKVMWSACRTDPGAFRAAAGAGPELGADSWTAIGGSAPEDLWPAVGGALRAAYAQRPVLLPAFIAFQERQGLDVVRELLETAREVIRPTTARRIAVDAVHQSLGIQGTARESVTLAGTIWPEHEDVKPRLALMREVATQEIVTGTGELGPVLLDAAGWSGVVGAVRATIEDAQRAAERSAAEAQQAIARAQELQESLERRRERIQEVQQQRTSDQSSSTQRMATALFRPIARALTDSFEANSLSALQDLLMVALGRAGIEPIAEPGSVVTFDPDLHVWVGEGYPPSQVRVIAPGFTTRTEGMDVVVLAHARVSDPEAAD